MNLFFKPSPSEIHPESMSELKAWSKKWKISTDELCQAIINTGSTDARLLKDYIKKNKPVHHHPLFDWRQLLTGFGLHLSRD